VSDDLRYISKDGDGWRVRVARDGQRVSIGRYGDLSEAIAARDYALQGTQEARSEAIADYEVAIPDNIDYVTDKPLTLSLDRWIYATDFHTPLHHREWIKRMVLVARHYDVPDLVVGGDFLDFASVSKHPKTQRQAGLNDTLRVAGDLLVALAALFERIILLPGNHCRRVANKLDEPLDFNRLIHAALEGRVSAERIITTNLDYLYVGEVETGFVVGHPRYFEGAGVPGLSKSAIRERRHAIGSHTHATSISWTHDGRFMVIYPGHMSDVDKTPYIQESRGLSKYAEWRNGFVLIDDGIPTLFSDGLVNWQRYGVRV
jgi:hypothetical protein